MPNILSAIGGGFRRVPGMLRDALTENTPGTVITDRYGTIVDVTPPKRNIRPLLRDAIGGFMAGAATPNIAYGGGTDVMRAGLAGLEQTRAWDMQDESRQLAQLREARAREAMQAQAERDRAEADYRRSLAIQREEPRWAPAGSGKMMNQFGETRPIAPESTMGIVVAPSGDKTTNVQRYGQGFRDPMAKIDYPAYGATEQIPISDWEKIREKELAAEKLAQPPNPPRQAAPQFFTTDVGGKPTITAAPALKPGESFTLPGVIARKNGVRSGPTGAKDTQGETIRRLSAKVVQDTLAGGGTSYADALANIENYYYDNPEMNKHRSAIKADLIRIIGRDDMGQPVDAEQKKLPPRVGAVANAAQPAATVEKPVQAGGPSQQNAAAAPAQVFPRSRLAAYAARRGENAAQTEQFLKSQGWVIQ